LRFLPSHYLIDFHDYLHAAVLLYKPTGAIIMIEIILAVGGTPADVPDAAKLNDFDN
jgi:hypothetical protein